MSSQQASSSRVGRESIKNSAGQLPATSTVSQAKNFWYVSGPKMASKKRGANIIWL